MTTKTDVKALRQGVEKDRRRGNMKVITIKEGSKDSLHDWGNSVHIQDNDGRNCVFHQSEVRTLIALLKKATSAKGIPRDEFDREG